MVLGSYLGELKTKVHKLTHSQNQCRSHSRESRFSHNPWAGGLQPWFRANVNDLLNITRWRKRHHVQISKQWGRGSWKSLFIQLVLNASLLANVFENLSHNPRNQRNQESCMPPHTSLSASTIKPSAEREELCYVCGLRWEGSHSHLLKHIFNWGVISIKLNVQPLAVQMDFDNCMYSCKQ